MGDKDIKIGIEGGKGTEEEEAKQKQDVKVDVNVDVSGVGTGTASQSSSYDSTSLLPSVSSERGGKEGKEEGSKEGSKGVRIVRNDLTLEEINRIKFDAEDKISQILADFTKDTSLKVDGVILLILQFSDGRIKKYSIDLNVYL